MSWGKWGKSFFVAGAAHCRLEGWKMVISLHRRRVSWRWDVWVAVILRFAVSDWCFRGVEPRCYIGICDAECLLRTSLLREVSCKTLVLEAWIVTFGESLVENVVLEAWILTFGESLVENARFGSLDCHLWWKSRGKCRFGSLDSHFWWKSRGKCSFWKLGLSLVVKVSWKMLVLEAWIVTFGESLVENACFGSLDCHFWSVQ